MPSGPKKRKAAKKKKGLEAINSSSSTTNGNASQVLGRYNLKGQDESKCNGSEVGYSLLQKHDNLQRPFVEENGVCLEQNQNVKLEDDGIVKSEVNVNVRQADKSDEVGVEHVECTFKDIEDKLNRRCDMLCEAGKTLIKSKVISDEMLPKSSDVRGVPETNLTPRKESSKVFPISDEKVDSTANRTEGKSLLSSVIHRAETTECIEKQPLVGSAPRLVEKTSWLSCCGLFDIFVGFDR